MDDGTLKAHAALVADGLLEPLSTDREDTVLWMCCQVVSLIENRFFKMVHPESLTPSQLRYWRPRLLHEGNRFTNPHHSSYTRPYWIKHGDTRIGTIVLSTDTLRTGLIDVSYLYIFPEYRGLQLAISSLRHAYDIVCAHGASGFRGSTNWTWQPAVRLYVLRLGAWLMNWKRALVFMLCKEFPSYRMEIGTEKARFDFVEESGIRPFIKAFRRGDRLGWRQAPFTDDYSNEPEYYAAQTFAVGLALHGWPLIRSKARWKKRYQSMDAGAPEGLAYKIEIFEAVDRKAGFKIRTPRIPGLVYRGYDDID